LRNLQQGPNPAYILCTNKNAKLLEVLIMSKKSAKKKQMLGKQLKRNRRIPVLAMLRTHRKISYNKFQRDWRHRKLKIKA